MGEHPQEARLNEMFWKDNSVGRGNSQTIARVKEQVTGVGGVEGRGEVRVSKDARETHILREQSAEGKGSNEEEENWERRQEMEEWEIVRVGAT
jgi:hypothetical protein